MIALYLATRRGKLQPKSCEQYRESLTWFAAELGERPFAAATIDNVVRYFDTRLAPDHDRIPHITSKPASGATIIPVWSLRSAHKHRSALHRFYRWLVEREVAQSNPVATYELRQVPIQKLVIVPSTDLTALLEFVEQEYTAAIVANDTKAAALYALDSCVFGFLYEWGLRVSEATNVRVEDITGTYPLLVRFRKKGGKSKQYPIVGPLLHIYARWLRVLSTIRIAAGSEHRLFIHPWTGVGISRQRTNTRLAKLAERAAIPLETQALLTPHKFRHSFAQRLLDSGEPLPVVQAVLDHASPNTTMLYVQPDEQTRMDTICRAMQRPQS